MKVIVIGGGPAGMMSAISSAENGNDVTIIEKMQSLGRKLLITGKGRCNITSSLDMDEFIKNIPGNGMFLYSAFKNYTNQDIIKLLKEEGLEVKEERGNRIFPVTDKSLDVLKCFEKKLKSLNVNIILNTKVKEILVEDNIVKGVKTEKEIINADKVILATGGKSYPLTGSTGDGYVMAQKLGHTVTKINPSLVPLEAFDKETCKNLQGLSLKNVQIELIDKNKNKVIYEDFGEMLFTHFGVSGPAVLKLSSYITKALSEGEVEVSLDFLKDKSKDEISQIMRSNPNKTVLNNLKGVLPQNFLKVVFEMLGLTEIKSSDLKKEDENKIIEYMKEMKLTARETLTIKAAQVTSGGVKVKEINASTMESKVIKNLYFAGEVIDIDAETGGYNLQMAFSTGYLAGSDY